MNYFFSTLRSSGTPSSTAARLLGLAGLLFLSSVQAAEHFVSSDDDIRDLTGSGGIAPGDIVTWRDGTYVDQGINFNAMGTATARITLRAETRGGVILKGKSFIKFGGDYITADGFLFYNGDDYLQEIGSSVVQFRSNSGNRHAHHCRLTNTAIIDMNSHEQDVDDDDEDGDRIEFIFHNSKWVQLYGTNNRVDHCHFEQKKVRGALIIFELVPQTGEDGEPYPAYNHRIDHNSFGPNPVGFSGNEFETIRIGTSDYANFNAASTVEYNHFYRCDGEIEVISNKSSNNIIRYNTLVESQGSIVMRHGDGALVEGNIILGNNVPNTGGIRLNGQDHIVRNNYIAGTAGTGLRAALVLRRAGSVSSDDTNGGYEQVRFAQITHNTFIDNAQTFNLAEPGSKDNSQIPTASTIANNILHSTTGPLITHGSTPTSFTYATNLAFGATVGFTHAGFTNFDPALAAAADGLLRPTSGSPAIASANATYAVATDLDGETRPNPADIGADQTNANSTAVAPLSASVVGPSWTSDFAIGGGDGSGGGGDPVTPTTTAGFIANLSIRAQLQNANTSVVAPITPGFVITGTGSKRIMIRAIGPTLGTLGVAGSLANPTLTLFDRDGSQIGFNDDWGSDNATAISAAVTVSGAFALDAASQDAALLADLDPGLYTASLQSTDQSPGVALLELYDVDRDASANRLANVSVRAQVGAGDNVLIPGIVVAGNSAQTFLLRAVGPTLADYGVTGVLADPVLELLSGQSVLANNDNWSEAADADAVSAAAVSTGAFTLPSGSADAALLVQLEPGVYTARVSGAGATAGEALVEVYAVAPVTD